MTTANPPCSIVHLGPQHLQLMEGVNTLFGQVFGDKDTYCKHRPRPEYLQRLLARDSFVALAAINAETGEPVGALARIFHRSRATNEDGIALVCPKIQVSNLDQRAGNAEAKLYRRN